jgi:hypothetical protein
MKELGRKGGKASGSVKPEQVPASLREELRKLDPAIVRGAIEQALAGGNESARVSAVKLLADIDAFRKDEAVGCPRCAKFTEAESEAARAKVDELISRYVERAVRRELGVTTYDEQSDSPAGKLVREAVRRALAGREHDLEVGIQTAVGKVLDAIANGLTVPGDVSSEEAEAILATLEERGLLVPRGRVEAMAEEIAQERLAALKQEHGIPA